MMKAMLKSMVPPTKCRRYMKTSFHLKHRHQRPRRVRSLADRWAARKKIISRIAYVCALGATRFFEKFVCSQRRFPMGGYASNPFRSAINGKGEVVLSQAQQDKIAEAELQPGERHNPFFVSGTQLAQALKGYKRHTHDGLNL